MKKTTNATVTVPEGIVFRYYAGIARDDHNVTLVPGIYPLFVQTNPEGYVQFITASVPTTSGETYGLSFRGYQLLKAVNDGAFTFGGLDEILGMTGVE